MASPRERGRAGFFARLLGRIPRLLAQNDSYGHLLHRIPRLLAQDGRWRGGAGPVTLSTFVAAAWLALVPLAPAFAEGPTMTPSSVPAGDPRFGAVEAFRAPDLASKAGVGWERILFWWYGVEPNGPADWNASYLPDSILNGELAAGRTVVGCLLNPPFWASGSGRPADPPLNLHLPYDSPDNYWGQFVKRIVSRYKGRIDNWIIGNEPDVWDAKNAAFSWNGSVQDFYQFVKVAYQAAKAVNPSATVGLPGLTYWWDKEYGRELYFNRLIEVAKQDPSAPANDWYFDFASLQLYNDPKALYDVPRLFRQAMAAAGIAEKPIWITETNVAPWDDPEDPLPRERFRATLEEQADYTIQAFAYALAGGAARIAIYKMADSPDLPPRVERYGLMRANGSTRPAYQAFQTVAKYLSGVRGGSVARDGSVVRIVFERGGQQVSVVWNQSPQPMVARLPAAGKSALVVDRGGRTRTARPQDGYYSLPLAGATANTVPGAPNEYRIGGSPLIVVEDALVADDAFADSAATDGWLDGVTGFGVSGEWLAAFKAMGGLDNLGHPRSKVKADPRMGGQTVQLFQRAILEYHPENADPDRIQRRLLGDILYPGADPPVDAGDAPPEPYSYFPQSEGSPTGLGHFVADKTRDGEPTYFKEFFDSHGGVVAFGYPKEEPKRRDGLWTQRFQAAVLQYHPKNDVDGTVPATDIPLRNYRVQAALLGDEYIAKYGAP